MGVEKLFMVAVALGVLVGARGASARAHPAPELDFERLGSSFLAASELAEGESSDVGQVLGETAYRIDLGGFDLRYPKSHLRQDASFERLREVLLALVELHRVWIEWCTGGDPPKDVEDALEQIEKLLRGWKGLDEGAKPGAGDLLTGIATKEKQVEALARLRDYVRSGEVLGLEREPGPGALVALCPTRRHFLEMAAYLGSTDDTLRGILWRDEVGTWTEYWTTYPNEMQVVAMEYAVLPVTMARLDRGADMNAREETGLAQHVLQRAFYSLTWSTFGRGLDPVFEGGLAQNVVIDVLGENNARSGGSGRGGESAAFEVFVPGGVPQGGRLPGISADSRWRTDKGSDHFVAALRGAQADGAREAGKKASKVAHFLLRADTGGGAHLVDSPFLGTAGQSQEAAPQEYLADYLEFYRAYKSAFVHWLRTQGAGKSKKTCAKKWSELLRALARGDEGGLEAACLEVYGLPLSGTDGEEPSLEWSFLEALPKMKG